MALYYEDQPESLTFLDSGVLTFAFVQQVKRFQIDIFAQSDVSIAVYIDEDPPLQFTLLATGRRERRPFALPPGLRGFEFRVTLTTTNLPFLCYDLTGFFKQLGTDQDYQQADLLKGPMPSGRT